MATWTVIALLCGAIMVILLARAIYVVRTEKSDERGSLPGKGDHIIEANYHSGGAGGGHSSTFRVPKDPQEYARSFVPKDKR